MRVSRLTIQAIVLVSIASSFHASADAPEVYSINALSLTTATQLLPSSFSERDLSRSTQADYGAQASANSVTEEMVVTASRIKPTINKLPAFLQAVVNDIEHLDAKKEEVRWLSSLSDKPKTRLTIGFDPQFEYYNRSSVNLPSSGATERPATSVLRVNF